MTFLNEFFTASTLKCIGASIIIHFFFLTNFFIIFPPLESSAEKPQFSFLGSILKKNEVREISYDKDINQIHKSKEIYKQLESYLKGLTEKGQELNKKPYSYLDSNKPLDLNIIKPKQKMTLKSSFEVSGKNPPDKKDDLNKSVRELNSEPYVPLKYYLK